MLPDSSKNVSGISTSAFPKDLANTIDLHKTRPLALILGSEPFVPDIIQMVSSFNQENMTSKEFIDAGIFMTSFQVTGPNLRPYIRDTNTKQEEGFNVELEIWLMNSTKKVIKWA